MFFIWSSTFPAVSFTTPNLSSNNSVWKFKASKSSWDFCKLFPTSTNSVSNWIFSICLFLTSNPISLSGCCCKIVLINCDLASSFCACCTFCIPIISALYALNLLAIPFKVAWDFCISAFKVVFNSSTFAFLNSSNAASSILYPSADFKILSTKLGYNVNNSKISDLLNVAFSSLFFEIASSKDWICSLANLIFSFNLSYSLVVAAISALSFSNWLACSEANPNLFLCSLIKLFKASSKYLLPLAKRIRLLYHVW